jgi:hypothetical protein
MRVFQNFFFGHVAHYLQKIPAVAGSVIAPCIMSAIA